jgi:outer membrane receptor protein involved in Fe transport
VRLRHAFTDKRYDFANPTGLKALDPSHEASLAFDWRPDSQTRFRVVVDNLLDERVGGAIGHAALPRRVRLGLSRSFE